MAGIWAVFAAYAAAPTVPLKGTWTATLPPTFGPVSASSGFAPFQSLGAVTVMPCLMDVTGKEFT
jgi:hypothetical protein